VALIEKGCFSSREGVGLKGVKKLLALKVLLTGRCEGYPRGEGGESDLARRKKGSLHGDAPSQPSGPGRRPLSISTIMPELVRVGRF